VNTPLVRSRRAFIKALAPISLAHIARVVQPPQSAFSARELADYRLTDEVFRRFAHATRLIASATRHDARFEQQPLLTKDIVVAGDAAEMATALQSRLEGEPSVAVALFAADISSHEYATFSISMFAARLAHGFVASGAMRRVPAGVASDNVTFVGRHEREIAVLLKQLRLE
jgi:hypothetical protein